MARSARSMADDLQFIVGAVSGIWDIVEKIQASNQAARDEVTRALNSVADIRTVANATGMGTQRVQETQFAFQKGAGLSTRETQSALFSVTGVLGRARQGDAPALALLKRLGIGSTPEALRGMSTDSFMRKGLAGLARQSDVTQRAADAEALFSAEPAAKLSASAGDLVSGLETFTKEAYEYGVVLNDSAITATTQKAQLETFGRNLGDINERIRTLSEIVPGELRELPETYNKYEKIRQEKSTTKGSEEAADDLVRFSMNRNLDEIDNHIISSIENYNTIVQKWNEDINKIGEELSEHLRSILDSIRSDLNSRPDDSTEGRFPNKRASGGPVSAYESYLVGERGPELFVPRGAGSIVPNHRLGGGSSWPWSGSSPEVGEARGAIEDLQALLDELGFDWQNTFERMKGVLLDFAETGKFEWRDLAKIALEAIEGMLMRWLDLQQQTAAGSGGSASGKTNWWRVAAELAYTAASAYFSRGASGASTASGASSVNGTTAGSGGPASGQFRAAGGPVSAFSPYVVGEQGPELFIPRVPGDIVPNHALGSAMGGASRPSVNQTIVFNVSPGVPEAVRREVAAMIPAITQAAKAGVASDIDRNGALRRRMN